MRGPLSEPIAKGNHMRDVRKARFYFERFLAREPAGARGPNRSGAC
jgi:hypothetical protein